MIRILLAEDDEAMRSYLARALQRNGYDVTTAATGREALELVESGTFDLLLTDIVMPEMDGIELAQKAQALSPAPKVMFITGFAAVALQANDAVPDARLLSKPFHLKDLVAQVDAMFGGAGQAGNG
ncbi:response regulator [Sphingomonas lacunae]|uniref:Response regulator n=1 Tax=Sphingomonas lacunae TaxID=2698828 RepID=A0A6M4AU64_9SPHN|nr:response regulator [Sphingomonas lacunae]QJQ32625.1 response regulator [Sphingomonas lacunae]